MAHTTFDHPLTLPALAPARALSRLRPAWLLVALVLALGSVGILAGHTVEQQLMQERAAAVAEVEAAQTALRAALDANALTALRADDLRPAIAEQEAALASTDGFLK